MHIKLLLLIITFSVNIGAMTSRAPIIAHLISAGKAKNNNKRKRLITDETAVQQALTSAKKLRIEQIVKNDLLCQIAQEQDKEQLNAILLSAVKQNKLTIVQFLQAQGIDIFSKKILLFEALTNGSFEVVKYLVEQDPNFNQKIFLKTVFNNTLLHLAVSSNNTELIQYILGVIKSLANAQEFQQLLNAQNKAGDTALHAVVRKENILAVKLLCQHLSYPLSVNNARQNVLLLALESNNIEIAHILISYVKTSFHTQLSDFCNIYSEVNEQSSNISKWTSFAPTALHRAAYKGNKSLVELLLRSGARPFLADTVFTIQPIDLAGTNKHYEIVKILLQQEQVLQRQNRIDKCLQNALLLKSDPEVIQFLLQLGANTNQFDAQLGTHVNLTRKLFSIDIPVKKTNYIEYRKPLNSPQSDYYTQIIKLLLDAGMVANSKTPASQQAPGSHTPDPNAGEQPLHVAAQAHNIPVIKLLLSYGADSKAINNNGESALHYAVSQCKQNFIERHKTVEFLLSLGLNKQQKNNNGKSAVWYACQQPLSRHVTEQQENHQLDLIKLLFYPQVISEKDTVNKETIINVAANSSPAIIRFLFQQKVDSNNTDVGGNTPLHSAVIYARNNLKLIQALLESKADVNKYNSLGQTPLMLLLTTPLRKPACIELVDLLVNKGAIINTRDKTNRTVFQILFERLGSLCHDSDYVIEHEYIEFFEELIKRGFSFSQRDIHARNLVHTAILDNVPLSFVKFLLDNEIPVNAQDDKNRTALHYVCAWGKKEILFDLIQLLLAYKADKTCKDSAGKYAYELLLERADFKEQERAEIFQKLF